MVVVQAVLGREPPTTVLAVAVPPILRPQVGCSHPSVPIPPQCYSLPVVAVAHPMAEMAVVAVVHLVQLERAHAHRERNHQAAPSFMLHNVHTPVVNVAAAVAAGTAAMVDHLKTSQVAVAAAI